MVLGAIPELKSAKPESSIGVRHVVIFLLFLATTISYAIRVSMSIAIVAMTTENDYGYPVFDWDRSVQDTILSSFFWGYIVLQIPAGMLAGRFGGKILIFCGMLITAFVNALVPLAASYGGWMAVCATRVFVGLSQGLLYPSIHGLLGQWVPTAERSRLSTIVYSGVDFTGTTTLFNIIGVFFNILYMQGVAKRKNNSTFFYKKSAQLGTIIEMVAAGVLSASPWGWPSVYYVSSAVCFLWCALWYTFGASNPATSWLISKEERKYIETYVDSADISAKKNMKTPWKSIWTSMSFWAILIAHSGQSVGFWTLLTEMPSYLSKVLGVDIKNNGILSALPYVAMYLLSFVFSGLSDYLVNRQVVSIGTARKIFNTIAFWGPAIALLVLSYLPQGHITIAVVILVITVGLNGAHYVGFLISHIDLAPNFASTLMGITNGLGNVFSIMAPLTVTIFVQDETSAAEWRKVFFISIGFYALGNLFFLIFNSGDIQPWNDITPKHTIEDGVKQNETETKREKSIADEKL